jgi:hypothetical protein
VFVAFLARNCLDVFRSQNKILSTDKSDAGWTCMHGRTTEWLHCASRNKGGSARASRFPSHSAHTNYTPTQHA